MTTTIFITGDRSVPNALAFKLVQAVMINVIARHQDELLANTLRFATGDAKNGIERAVRFVIPEEFLTVVERGKTPEGHIDWDKGALDASKIADKAVVIHMDPQNSRVTKSVLTYFKVVELPLTALDSTKIQDTPVELSKNEVDTFEELMKGVTFDTDEKKSE